MNRSLFTGLAAALLALAGLARPAGAQMVNAQTGTTYTVLNTDCDPQGRKIVTFNNAASVAVTLPQAGASGQFLTGCVINVENIGLGTVTITPTTSTIANQTSVAILGGTSAAIYNDANGSTTGNYWVSVGAAAFGGIPGPNFRNVVGNGGMAIQQRGTAERTGGTTTIPSSAYSADRWGCNANVTSGAAFCASSVTSPPVGFVGFQTVYRKTGALTQPVCMMQEIPSVDSTALQGTTATLSFYGKALGGLIADNGGVVNAYIFTGTGADEGLQTFTASPAITPAWTGITSNRTAAFTLTSTAFQRFSFSGAIPPAATELGVAICFTPTATGSGVTDGFAFTGVQLEQGAFATPFEFRPLAVETALSQFFYQQIKEGAASTVRGLCNTTTANTTESCFIPFPTMRKAPTAVLTAGFAGTTTTAGTTATNCSALALSALISGNATNPNGIYAQCTLTSSTIAVGLAMPLIDNGGAGLITLSADF